ncbi:MAG: fibronectin type III domain-containing protein, partial [Candidatus Nanopelagicaceae bacterium]
REPGPLLLAMMEDMRIKPPAGIAVGIPNQVRNLQVLVGDSSAIITFDPPTNVRSAQVTSYAIKNSKTGVTSYANSSPVNITGLKNGTSYSFTVSAINSNGASEPLSSDSIMPIATWKSSVIDNASDAKYLVSSTLNNKPFIAYISSKTGTLRMATFSGGTWKKVVIDGMGGSAGRTNHKVGGHLSLCTTGSGSRQVIHLFYGDVIDNDLRHATISDTALSFEVVDGNAATIQSYEQADRVRTGSDVSYSSACVATTTTLQVFYRDESQGVLLGAVKKSNKWSYELIDGDRKTDGRSTGDVAFHLDAILSGATTYLIYDSVLVVNQKKEATSGEIRLATRDGATANTWSYQTLESPSTTASVLGYDVAIAKVAGKLTGVWFAASGATLPNPSQIRTQVIDGAANTLTTAKFGAPSAPINL